MLSNLSNYATDLVYRIGDGAGELHSLSADMDETKMTVNAFAIGGTYQNFGFTGQGVTVGVIDSQSVAENHLDLPIGVDNTVEKFSCTNTDTRKCIIKNGFVSTQHHGTRVAGIVAGQGSIESSMTGVARDSHIIAISTVIVGTGIDAQTRLIMSLDWALRQGSDIANITTFSDPRCTDYTVMTILMDEAMDEGMTIVTGAGNEGSGDNIDNFIGKRIIDISCGYNGISVGAVYDNIDMWESSSRGPAEFGDPGDEGYLPPRLKPELVAPAVNIRTLDSTGGYSHDSGTSFAAPIVTGAAALIKDTGAAPYYTPLETKMALLLGADWDPQNNIPSSAYPLTAEDYEDLGDVNPNDIIYRTLNSYGFGLLDVEQSLTFATSLENDLTKNYIIRDTISESDGLKSYTFTVDFNQQNIQSEIILSWLSQPIDHTLIANDGTVIGNIDIDNIPVSNLDFEIRDPDNIQVGITRSLHQNNEFLVFTPQKTGTYTIFVSGDSVDLQNIVAERFVIGSTIPLDIPSGNLPPQINAFPDYIAIEKNSDGTYYPFSLFLSANDANNDILSFYVTDEPDEGKLSPPLKASRDIARVLYQANPDFGGSDRFSFKVYDGKTISGGIPTQVVIGDESITPPHELEKLLLSPPPTIDDASSKFFDDDIKYTTLSFTPPANPISALYVNSDVPATLSFDASPTSHVALDGITGKLITFTDSFGINPANIRVSAQDTTEDDSVTIGFEFVDVTVPDAPTDLSATAVSFSQIDLLWTEPANGGSDITGYKIERKLSTDPTFDNSTVFNTGTLNPIMFTDNGTILPPLLPSESYDYQVSAINAVGTSLPSEVKTVSYNLTLLKSILDKIETERVDFVGLGAINMNCCGAGWDHGFQKALSDRYDMFATGMLSFNENNGWGASSGYQYQAQSGFTVGANTGAPTPLDKYDGPSLHQDYAYIDDFTTMASTATGMGIWDVSPIDVNANLRFDFHYGTFENQDGDGQFVPGIRKAIPPYTVLHIDPAVNPVTGSYGITKQSIILDADVRNHHLEAGFRIPGQGDIQGPFFGNHIRAINLDRDSGFSFNLMTRNNELSLRDIAEELQNTDDAFFTHYFGNIRNVQLESPNNANEANVVILISSGYKDQWEYNTSVGPAQIAQGNSAEAYKDNAQAIINEITLQWSNNNWDDSELYFVFMPVQEVADPDWEQIENYRSITYDLIDDNPALKVAVLDFTDFIDNPKIIENEWSNSSTQSIILNKDGYEGMASMALDHVLGVTAQQQQASAASSSSGSLLSSTAVSSEDANTTFDISSDEKIIKDGILGSLEIYEPAYHYYFNSDVWKLEQQENFDISTLGYVPAESLSYPFTVAVSLGPFTESDEFAMIDSIRTVQNNNNPDGNNQKYVESTPDEDNLIYEDNSIDARNSLVQKMILEKDFADKLNHEVKTVLSALDYVYGFTAQERHSMVLVWSDASQQNMPQIYVDGTNISDGLNDYSYDYVISNLPNNLDRLDSKSKFDYHVNDVDVYNVELSGVQIRELSEVDK